MSEETEKIVIEKPKKMTDCKVVPIGPILKNDMRRKWIISFQPEIPDDLIFDDKTEFSAFIKDKSFFENNLVKNHEAFKIDDILICDLKYVVYHYDGSLFCKIKDVEVLDVKKHI